MSDRLVLPKRLQKFDTLFISFSGGRTSAYMTKMILERLPEGVKPLVVFANTGQEHEHTLEFINACDKEFGFNTIWLETVVHHGQRKRCTHKIVDFETATRDDSLFREVIKKYGVPNKGFPHCTRELKLNPMLSFMGEQGFSGNNYITAIGIRSDERDRVSGSMFDLNYWYPLVDQEVTKEMILKYWTEEAPFDLDLPERYGNCVWCWKKSFNKLRAIYHDNPAFFGPPARLERDLSNARPERGEQFFWRGKLSTEDLLEAFGNNNPMEDDPNYENSCAESCEAFK